VVLDGWGGLHGVSFGGTPPVPNHAPYWLGWDIARGVTILPDGTGGYILDGWGGRHPFGLNGQAPPSQASPGAPPYWPSWDIARGISAPFVDPQGDGGWVVDAFGGIHPWGQLAGGPVAAAAAGPYWPGQSLARGITSLPGGMGGFVVDAWGGLHRFASPGVP
jgi:hypothetical protein